MEPHGELSKEEIKKRCSDAIEPALMDADSVRRRMRILNLLEWHVHKEEIIRMHKILKLKGILRENDELPDMSRYP